MRAAKPRDRRLLLGAPLLLFLGVVTSGCNGCDTRALRVEVRRWGAPSCLYNTECRGTRVCPSPNTGPVCRRLGPEKGFCECLSTSWPEDAGSLFGDKQWCEENVCEIREWRGDAGAR
jgi:hypothetical protein